MKQSKKLLSIFLAMLMLLGTVSVIGNAGYVKEQMAYDSVDNPAPNYNQVATLVLDVLDTEVLPGLGVDEEILGITINLTSVDGIFATLDSVKGILWLLATCDVGKLNLDAVDDKQTRANTGDLQLVYNLLQFLDDNSDILGKAAYGIGTTNGISLGIIGSFVDLGSINAILENIPGFLAEMVYDMLIHGSYDSAGRFDMSAEEHKAASGSLPTGVQTLDEIVNTAIQGLLTKPQQYSYNEAGEKVWDMNSYILTADKLVDENGNALDLTLTNNSIFSIIDKIIQIAYEDFGTVALNHDVKKLFMEGMGVDFVEVTDAAELAKIKADADYVDVEAAEKDPSIDVTSVKNYFCNAQMWEVDGVWYFRDYVTRDVIDPATGSAKVDAEGNVVTHKVHRYQRAEAYTADSLYGLFNWDYQLTGTTLNFNDMIGTYGSIIGSLNHLLYVIFKEAINVSALGLSSIDEIWVDGSNDNFNENLMTTAKFLLKKFTFKFFGRNEAYVDLKTLEAKPEFVAKLDTFGNNAEGREGLIAYMLLPFLGDALPQLVYDVDMFDAGLQIEQVAVLLVREFLSDLTPQINYDDQIFVDDSLVKGREFQDKSSAQWIELLLNMGLDLGATYLDNICNIALDAATLAQVKSFAVAAGDPAYMGVLEEIVDYAVNYVGEGETSILVGCEPSTLNSVRCVTSYDYTNDTVQVANNYAGNAFTILSTILNKLLPLGVLCNVTSYNEDSSIKFALDIEMVFKRLIDVIDDLDLEVLLQTFGRNGLNELNLFEGTNIINQVLGLVNKLLSCIFGRNLFPVTTSLNGAIAQSSLKQIIINLLDGLNSVKKGLLPNALPIVAAFVDDWGSEQALRSPTLSIDDVTRASNGALNYTVNLSNGSRGIWRGYMKNGQREQDEQYTYTILSITGAQNKVTIGSGWEGALPYGQTKQFTLTGTIPAAGFADRFDVVYQVSDEDGNLMDGGKSYVKSYFTYFSFADRVVENRYEDDEYELYIDKYLYVADDDLGSLNGRNIGGFYNPKSGERWFKFENTGAASQGGIVFTPENETVPKESAISVAPFSYDAASFEDVGTAGKAYVFNYKYYYRISKYQAWPPAYVEGDPYGFTDGTDTTIYVYDAETRGQLESLVSEETSLNRRPEDYKDAGAYGTYLGALANAISVAWNPRYDASFVLDATPALNALKTAIEALEATRYTKEELAQQSGETVAAAIAKLAEKVNEVESGLKGKDYRTHMLYRWSRYQDALKDAKYAVALEAEYSAGKATQKFPYNSMPIYELNELISGNAYEAYIKALYQNLNEQEALEAEARFKDVTNQYAGFTTLDIAQYSNLLTRMSTRLLPREGGVVNSYLTKEIESAKAVIGDTNTAGYSERSWNAYSAALQNAESVKNDVSQDKIFAAKYALQVARNNLRTEAQEADYSELENLIAQAQYVFNNIGLYNNTDAEFGAVLAALGYEIGTTDIFPDSALNVNSVSIDKHDQEDVDDAADALKKALSRMEFKGASYAGAEVVDKEVITGEEAEDGNKVTETVRITKLSAKELLADVTAKFSGTTATDASGATVKISLDDSYTLDDDNANKFVGTGATITIYTTASGVTIPLSTIKVVVDGDLTGDGVIDVIDCAIVEFAAHGNASPTGVFALAGDGNADNTFDIENDLQYVTNIAIKQVQ